MAQIADSPVELWDTGCRGWSRVDESFPKGKGFSSLYLVTGDSPAIVEVGSRPKTLGSTEQKLFKNLQLSYGGVEHEFRISDPVFDEEYASNFPSVGASKKIFVLPENTYVTVSLTPAYSFNGKSPRYHYKMAAAIIKPRAQ